MHPSFFPQIFFTLCPTAHPELLDVSAQGVVYDKGIMVETTDARGKANGKQVIADQAAFSAIMNLSERLTMEADRPRVSYRQGDFREAVRRMEVR